MTLLSTRPIRITGFLLALGFVLCVSLAHSQTPVPMSGQPGLTYTENFADIANWTNNFALGIGASRWGSVAINAAGSIPDGAKTTIATASFTTGTTGGVQKGAATIMLLTPGSTDNNAACAIDFFLDFTGANAGTLSFDWAQVANSTGNRNGSLRVYTSTNGTTFTELVGAAVLNVTNNVPSSGSITTVALPASFNNSATARIRFYDVNGTGGGPTPTGSRPKIAIDNVTVTATAITCGITLGPAAISTPCNANTNGVDTYNVSIPYSGSQAGVVITSNAGTVAGSDPTTGSGGVILVNGISEAVGYIVTFSSPCGSLSTSGPAPSCVPPCGLALGTVTATCNSLTAGSGDTYNLTIAYTGSQSGVTVVNSSGSGTVAGDDPAVTTNGIIQVNGISELNNYSVTFSAPCAALVASGNAPVCAPLPLAAWDFFGESVQATSIADVYNASMDASNLLTRGATAAASAGGNSFRTVGFQNDPIGTGNTDYFQCTLSADPGFALSLSTIDARMTGTSGYAVSPGVSSQFAYSLDGTNFILIGSPSLTVGIPATLPQVNVSGIPALQNVGAGITITLRYYASGQTSTGGWGFTSATAGAYGLAIDGSLAVVPITCDITLLAPTYNCDATTIGVDSYTISIPYTGLQTGVSVVNNSGSGTVGGNDPAVDLDGTITISGITEGQAYSVTLTSPCTDQIVSGASPTCYPPCTITPGTAIATCNGFSVGTGDTYNLSIPYTGSQAGVTVVNNSGSGTVGGDDPAATPVGTIVISGISELNNYSVTFSAPCAALVVSGTAPACVPPALAAWDFFGESSPATSTADVYNASLDASNLLTRGGGAAASTGTNSFRTQGFQSNGIATTNSDFFQLTLSTTSGYALSLATIDARMAGTSSFAAGLGVSSQFAYSLDGTNFTLIGTPSVTIGTPATLTQIDVTGIPALQNIGSGTTVTLRYYASGQTTTGGWGFTSSAAGVYGLRIGGSLTSVGAGCLVSLGTPTATCNTSTPGPDTYSVSIPYTGSQLSLTVINNSATGSVGGDDPGVAPPNGTIVISGISETDGYSITLSEPCNDQIFTGPAPLCEQPPLIVINEVDYDETGDDLKEFIELKNIGTDPSTLTGMKVILYNGSDASVYTTITLPNLSLAAGDYYVIGSASVPNVDQVMWVQNGIQNGAPDGIRLTTSTDVILDQMSYEGTMLTTEGSSAGTDPNPAGLGLSRLPDGTDTNDNGEDFVITCITPGTANGGADSDNDGTPDCLDVCPGGPEPGSVCDDLDDDTGNDVIQAITCTCAGQLIDCEGIIGGPNLPGVSCANEFHPSGDNNPFSINDTYQADCQCLGQVPDCLGTVGGPAVIGSSCNDFDPSTNDETYQPEPYCACVGTPCSQNVTIDLRTDTHSEQAGWEILYQNDATVVCSGGYPAAPYQTGVTSAITADCCLPIGCFRLRVLDSAGDGFSSGGYQLRETNGAQRRIIDNMGNFVDLPGGPPDVSAISNTLDLGAFCVPIGDVKLKFDHCDKLDWANHNYIVCSRDQDVYNAYSTTASTTGYEFWFFDPNGAFSHRRFRPHTVSDGITVADIKDRACHFHINRYAQDIPEGMLLNVRVRARVNGTNRPFGPACFFKLDAARAACPFVKLVDNPADANYSCGSVTGAVNRVFGGSNSNANKITSVAPQFQGLPAVLPANVRYQFRFRAEGEVGLQNPWACVVRPAQTSPTLYLNWTTGQKLKCQVTYSVDVRVSRDNGQNWCMGGANSAADCDVTVSPWGKVCYVKITSGGFCPVGLAGGSSNLAEEGQPTLTMYPNPNRGDQVFISLSEVDVDVSTVSLDIYDLTGQKVSARTVAIQDGYLNTVLELNGNLAQGLYLVNVTAGTKTYTERLVIE